MLKLSLTGGVWSACPTPLKENFQVDPDSVRRMVEHHLRMGVAGLFLAGTCGEGPWLTDRNREALTRAAAAASAGRMRLALQVTDNSSARVLDNIDKAAAWGAEIAVVAAPPVFIHVSPGRLVDHFREIVRHSPLPVGFYDGGEPLAIPEPLLPEFLDDPRLVLVKDSSSLESRIPIYAAARRRRPELLLLDGDEFACVRYLAAGYDGLLLGGAVFNARLAGAIFAAVRAGDLPRAEALQLRMSDLMYRVYGGRQIECWLAGLKGLLVEMGIFSTRTNLLGYTLTDTCRQQIRDALSGADGLGYREDLLGPATEPAGPKFPRAQTSA